MTAIAGSILLLFGLIFASAQAQDGSRDAVANLEAYAAYKSGSYDTAYEIWEKLANGGTMSSGEYAQRVQDGEP